ncbi:hypothetical protein L7F22_049002 [Adiantum nelumboides]|nr:hypothetical protein [Adiantum nelumboides]
MGLSSGRSNKGKAPAELPSLLEQHLPKRARCLVSPLSYDDLEVLTYMVAFGLHLQMLTGAVFPAQKLQQKFSSSVKVGVKYEVNFASSQSLSFLSSKSRSRFAKPTLLATHKTSCSCDCFSCYSSFWSRWVASPNRDLLSTIIEMAEMGDEEENRKPRRGKENTKKQAKKHVLGKGKKCKGENWMLPELSKHTPSSQSLSKMDDAMAASPNDAVSVSKSVDLLYNTLADEAPIATLVLGDSAVLTQGKDTLNPALEPKGTLAKGVALMGRTTRITLSCGDAYVAAPCGQVKTFLTTENEVARTGSAQAFPADSLQGKSSSRLHCTLKRKSNQIMPLDMEGTPTVKDDEEELGQLNESYGGSSPPRVLDASTEYRGVLSQVFPYTLCNIASRLWDLVSLGPRSHGMEYF